MSRETEAHRRTTSSRQRIQMRERIAYSPIVDRPALHWPGGARVAVWIVPNIELREYQPPNDPARDPWPRSPHPDVRQFSHHDYGNRVGFWRMLDILDRFELPITASLNLEILEQLPEIRDAIGERGWAVMSHGLTNTRYLYGLEAPAERAFYRRSVDLVRRHLSVPLLGMLGPSLSASERTPDLMAEAGLVYHADWAHDDQPVPIRVEAGRLISMPYSFELNDAPLFRSHFDGDDLVRICRAQLDRLLVESEESGRVMCLAVHPFLIGAPHRARAFERVLAELSDRRDVWYATGDEIATHYLDHEQEHARATGPVAQL
ncbi:MAG: polysaccharide deacetylase family protein [Acidimicrobiia bacterium]|nr:polysaccharide deacetylase family protein [Acidimicrobiia bacterium]